MSLGRLEGVGLGFLCEASSEPARGLEIRSTKSETIDDDANSNGKNCELSISVLSIGTLVFVSNFGFRDSNLNRAASPYRKGLQG
jgi:hypothetical protein